MNGGSIVPARAICLEVLRGKGQQVVAAVLIAGDSSIAYNAAGCALLNQIALWAFHRDAGTRPFNRQRGATMSPGS